MEAHFAVYKKEQAEWFCTAVHQAGGRFKRRVEFRNPRAVNIGEDVPVFIITAEWPDSAAELTEALKAWREGDELAFEG